MLISDASLHYTQEMEKMSSDAEHIFFLPCCFGLAQLTQQQCLVIYNRMEWKTLFMCRSHKAWEKPHTNLGAQFIIKQY